MMHRWQRWIRAAGLGPAFLAVLILAVSPAPVATAATGAQRGDPSAFWDRQAQLFDLGMGKALRPTAEEKRWEVLIDVEKNGEWSHQGYFDEISRRRPDSSKALDPAMKSLLDSLGTVLVIGKVGTSQGRTLYAVAAVFEEDSSLEDGTLKTFVPLHVDGSYQSALRFAQTFEKLYDGSFDSGGAFDPRRVEPGSPEFFEKDPAPACVNKCQKNHTANLRNCGIQYAGCGGAATVATAACVVACLGVPPCELLCAAAYLIAVAACTAALAGCESSADQLRDICLNSCPDEFGCSATAMETVTSAISLESETALGRKLGTAPITFPLSRAAKRGEQSFVLDEWAIVERGLVKASSNPAFGLAVTQQGELSGGPRLMIQEPVHDMNSRHVEKPQVRILSKRLARSEKGRGEIVAARLELSSATDVDRVEIVYTSEPMDKGRLEKMVSRRVNLAFASEKEHRTAAYVVFRLTDRFELLGSYTAFPKCCCGEEFCI